MDMNTQPKGQEPMAKKTYTRERWATELAKLQAALTNRPDRAIATAGEAATGNARGDLIAYERCNCHEKHQAWARDIRNRPGQPAHRRPGPSPETKFQIAMLDTLSQIAAGSGTPADREAASQVIDSNRKLVAQLRPKPAPKPDPEPICTHDPLEWDDE